MPLNNPISESQIPQPIARDVEFQAADAAHATAPDAHSQYLRKNGQHNTNGLPDSYTTGVTSEDLYINGILAGWHILTLLREGNNDFGVQLALADTQTSIYYRCKVYGVWQSWVKVNLTIS